MFYQQLWESQTPLFNKIYQLPFLQEMADGTLPKDVFYFYIEQDIHYLNDYARGASFLAGRSNSTRNLKQFLNIALETLKEQERVHHKFQNEHAYKETGQYTKAYCEYTDFIKYHVMNSPLAVAWGAMTPCPILYYQIASLYLKNNAVSQDSPYYFWFVENSSDIVKEYIHNVGTLLEELVMFSPDSKLQIESVFAEALQFEYQFWDDAYNKNIMINQKNLS